MIQAHAPFDPSAIEESLLRQLYDYWASKHRRRRLPGRADIDPSEMWSFLSNVILADTAETLGEFRYRLYGTEVCRGFEHDRTNIRFADLPNIQNYDEVYAGYWQAYQNAVPVYFRGRIVSSQRSWLKYSRLTLPLSSDGEHINMILGGVVFYTTGKSSSWLGGSIQ